MKCFLFSGLSPDESEKVGNILSKPVKFEKGAQLYRCGNIGILLSGNAKIIRRNEQGICVTIRSIGADEVFGAASVFGQWKEQLSSIVATTPCSVIYISEEELRYIFTEIPSVSFNYISFLTDRIRFLNRKIDTFSAGNTEKKLYEYLVSQADAEGSVSLEFGMAELARRLKIGRSSLYRSIEQLENGGLIKRDKNEFIII